MIPPRRQFGLRNGLWVPTQPALSPGGYPCCCVTEYEDCTDFCEPETIPDYFEGVFSGFVNEDCTDCEDLNDTFILERYLETCVYYYWFGIDPEDYLCYDEGWCGPYPPYDTGINYITLGVGRQSAPYALEDKFGIWIVIHFSRCVGVLSPVCTTSLVLYGELEEQDCSAIENVQCDYHNIHTAGNCDGHEWWEELCSLDSVQALVSSYP